MDPLPLPKQPNFTLCNIEDSNSRFSLSHILPGSCHTVIRLDGNVANIKRPMLDNDSQHVSVLFVQLL